MFKQLLVLSGIATICAVVNHTADYVIIAMFWWTDLYRPVTVPNYDAVGGLSYYTLLLVVQIAIAAVPAFLFISGFFIATMTGRNHERIGWKPIFRRIKFLIWPYLLWSLVIIFISIILDGKEFDLRGLPLVLISGSATGAFYYIPLLILLYLLSPFMSPIAKHRPWLLLAEGVLLLGLVVIARYAFFLGWSVGRLDSFFTLFRNSQFSANFIWFALGMVIGFHLPSFKKRLVRVKWGLLVTLIITYALALFEWRMLRLMTARPWLAPQSTAMNHLFMLVALLTYLAFANVSFPLSGQLSDVGSKAYGVYLIHIPALTIISKAVYHLAPKLLGHQILYMLILIIAGVGLPLLMMKVVSHSPASRYYQYIFG